MTGSDNRICWISNVRVIASFCIVILHVTSKIMFQEEIKEIPFQYISILILNGLTRFAVPVFFMISGILLLKNKRSIKQIYLKYIVHLINILLFWSFFYTAIINPDFKLNTWGGVFEAFEKVFNFDSHFWFIKVLIGIYMLVPMIYLMVQEQSVCTYYIALWLFLHIMPFIEIVTGIPVIKPISFLRMTVFNGYTGYFILGYWLNKYSGSMAKWYRWSWILSAVLISIFTLLISKENVNETFWDPLNPLIIWFSSSLLLFFKEYLNFRWKIILKCSDLTLGIYIIHIFIINQILPLIFPYRMCTYGILLCILQSIIVWLVSLTVTLSIRWLFPGLGGKIM